MRVFTLFLLLALAACLHGCRQKQPESQRSPSGSSDTRVQYVDATQAAGITFRHQSGAVGKKFMPETVGSGCAFLDYDGDGLLDLFYVNSTDWPGPKAVKHYPALYRNKGDGTFQDVTATAGLKLDAYGMGIAVADYDNDGDPDLFLTCIGPNHLYRNDGDGTFTDVTSHAGVAGRPVEPGGLRWKWSASASWLDYNRDGKLDLYVGNYVKWTPQTDPYCGRNGVKAYCAPTNFEGVPSLLYENLGGGRFRDVSDETGIGSSIGKSFGVAAADYNQDGWTDLAVSNDTSDNFFFINQQGKGFEDQALEWGMALAPSGSPRAGMGIDAADWENTGRFGLIIGNFSREGLALFSNTGSGRFQDVSHLSQIAEPSLLSLTFGTFFFDFDLDGRQDVFAANGHIDDFVRQSDAMIAYAQRALLYRGVPQGRFEDVTAQSGPALEQKRVLRGCAHGDVDNDGDEDIITVWNNRQGELWKAEGAEAANWVGLSLQGTQSNRDGIGALIRVRTRRGVQSFVRKSGGSFLSESDPRIRVGLADQNQAEEIEVRWPSGAVSSFKNVKASRYYHCIEGEGSLRESDSRPSRSASP